MLAGAQLCPDAAAADAGVCRGKALRQASPQQPGEKQRGRKRKRETIPPLLYEYEHHRSNYDETSLSASCRIAVAYEDKDDG